MKKLMLAAIIAASMAVTAQEPAKPAADEKPAVAEQTAKKPGRAGMRRSQMSAERKAKMEGQMLEVVKKYVPEEEKAKALVRELAETMMAARRNMMPHRARKPQK